MERLILSGQVAFFDIDGTLISENTWKSYVRHPEVTKARVRVAYLKAYPLWGLQKARIISDDRFRGLWVRAMAGVVSGWSRAHVRALFDWIVNERMIGHYREDVLRRLAEHKQQGNHVVLISGMFDVAVQAFAARLGADGAIGTPLAFDGDTCLGRTGGVGIAGVHKIAALQDYLVRHQLPTDLTQAHGYADSYSDRFLLGAVGHPTATYPDDELRALAQERGWAIIPQVTS